MLAPQPPATDAEGGVRMEDDGYPKCRHCSAKNYYGNKYQGYCFDCMNCGVEDLIAERDTAFAAGAAAMRERCIKECVGEAAHWRAEWLKAGQPEGSVGDKELAIEDCITGIKALPVPTPGDR